MPEISCLGFAMLLGILSDSHDQLARVERAMSALQNAGADTVIHCGDLSSPKILKACSGLPCYFTFGNHDADTVPALRSAANELGMTSLDWGGVVELHGKRVGVAHGHLRTDVRRVMDQSPDYLLSGHSHIPHDYLDGAVRRINPGALFRADTFTVAVLDLEIGSLRWVEIE